MNEMKLLEEFRAAVAPPHPVTLAQARARVLASARASAGSPDRSGRRLRWLTARRWLAALGAAAVVTAAAVTATVMLPAGSRPAPGRTAVTLTAATVLHRAALTALSAPVPRGDQYLFTDMEWAAPGAQVARIQQWQAVDGSSLTIVRTYPCVRWHGRKCAPFLSSYLVPQARHIFTYARLAKLPTAPGALLSYLYGEQARACPEVGIPLGRPAAGVDRAATEWSGISTILGDVPMLPPRFGAALFEAATRIPGVRVIMNVRDATGERGIAVAHALPEDTPDRGFAESSALIFRPQTYQFIGSAVTYPSGTVLTGLRASEFVRTAPAASGAVNRRPLTPSSAETCALYGTT